jgi:hypothetical protein
VIDGKKSGENLRDVEERRLPLVVAGVHDTNVIFELMKARRTSELARS